MTDTTSPWTVEDVANRFAEAAWTAHRLPRVGPRGYFNPWMTTAFQVPDRYPDPERLYRPMPPSPQDVERMLEAMRWVQWLEVEQRHLVWMRAKRYSWRDITIRFACDRTTAWRRWQQALQIVVDRLNAKPGIAISTS
jgi:hypothetical protein